MADYVSPDQRRRIAGGLMAAQYAENPPQAQPGYDWNVAPLSPGLMNFAAQRGQPGVIQKTLGLIPGFDQDGARGRQSWGNALMSTAQFPIDAVAGIGQAITAPARAYRGEFDPVSEEGVGEALNVAGNAMMGGLAAPKPRGVVGSAGGDLKGAALGAIPDTPGIRAYHGSPHDFDRFDIGKIGTGEGAQAYGHGLYFAENEGVAKSYRDALGGQRFADGAKFDDASPAHQASAYVAGTKSKDEAIAAINQDIAMSRRQMDEKHAQILLRARGLLDSDSPIPKLDQGKMYEVNIKANPDDFLDWDKPLSQQSEKVRALYDAEMRQKLKQRQIGDNPNLGPLTDVMVDGGGSLGVFTKDNLADVLANPSKYAPTTGADFLDDIARKSVNGDWGAPGDFARQQATNALREAGIPGIRYLDQGSRAGGEGSRNLVVFDDKLIEILRKYGLLGMAGGAAAAEYGTQNPMLPSRPASPQYRPGDA